MRIFPEKRGEARRNFGNLLCSSIEAASDLKQILREHLGSRAELGALPPIMTTSRNPGEIHAYRNFETGL